jgi:hypothetical protein
MPTLRTAPDQAVSQFANNIRTLGRAYANVSPWSSDSNPYAPSYTPDMNGYAGSPGSGYGGYTGDPYNGYLTGAAAVISSQGQFAKDWMASRLTKEEVKRSAIDTQRKMYEEWKYERNDQPALEQLRQEAIRRAWQRAVFHPPLQDIWSADALNRILDHASRIQGLGGMGRNTPLDQIVLKQINVSTGMAGNIGLLRNKGQLSWPMALEKNTFDKERERISDLAKRAVEQAQADSKVDRGTLEQLQDDAKALERKLSVRICDLDPNDYMDAKRYLKDFHQALTILKRKDASDFLNGNYRAKGRTVAELIKNMSSLGLRFAAAAPGDEAAYNALYQALAAYDLGLVKQSPGMR